MPVGGGAELRMRIIEKILADDGQLRFTVVRIEERDIVCRAEGGGTLRSAKGINVPMVTLRSSLVTDRDVVVHASTQPEPFGLTIVEAMACGRATVVAKAGGAGELFTDGEDAVGVPPNDVTALTDALYRLLTAPEERRRLGENAARTVVAAFSPDHLPKRVASVYGPLLWNGTAAD